MFSVREPLPDEITAVRPPDVLTREIARIGASSAELQAALAFNASESGFDARAYDALPPRTRRLVDLLAVAGKASELVIYRPVGAATATGAGTTAAASVGGTARASG